MTARFNMYPGLDPEEGKIGIKDNNGTILAFGNVP